MHDTHGNVTYPYGLNVQNGPPGFVQGSGYGNNKFQGGSSAFHGGNQGGNYNHTSMPHAPLHSSEPSKPAFEVLMSKLIEVQNSTNTINKQAIDSLQAGLHKLETQVGQMASSLHSRPQGSLPSNTVPNPHHNEQANAISILRSGKIYDNKAYMPQFHLILPCMLIIWGSIKCKTGGEIRWKTLLKGVQNSKSTPKGRNKAKDSHMTSGGPKDRSTPVYSSLGEAVLAMDPSGSQVPSYAKYLKELCTNKRRFKDDENVYFREEASSVIQRTLPPKLGDPGCFTVSCTIGLRNFDKTLLDLGASINLMPYEVYKTLALEDIKPVKIRLQMADQNVVYPRGVVEDVLVKIDEILVPADFVVLDMELLSRNREELPIILGGS
ncbi:uncharacterized protein LOC112177906 [Rosa chinensis]|uniref:uncharacterized protein LOC112177906 n=1 Tax=Rosa chinensis TaxID=74649 RepID=UPI000D090DD3|nr:uncharacterized protein LOC112177906 [Rosa chinensis]